MHGRMRVICIYVQSSRYKCFYNITPVDQRQINVGLLTTEYRAVWEPVN